MTEDFVTYGLEDEFPGRMGKTIDDSAEAWPMPDGLFEHRDDLALTHLKLRQIGFADLVVLNKVDLVGPENVAAIEKWIGEHLNRVRIVPASDANVPIEILLSVGRFDPAVIEDQHGNDDHHDHGTGFETWHYRSDVPLSGKALQETVRKFPAAVLRCKGFVETHESPGERMLLQSVGRRSSLTSLGPWGGHKSATDIVVIGTQHSLESEALQEALDACLVPGSREA